MSEEEKCKIVDSDDQLSEETQPVLEIYEEYENYDDIRELLEILIDLNSEPESYYSV